MAELPGRGSRKVDTAGGKLCNLNLERTDGPKRGVWVQGRAGRTWVSLDVSSDERATKNLIIYSFNKYLLSTCHIPKSVVLGTVNIRSEQEIEALTS